MGDHEPGSCEKVTTVTKRKEILRRYRRCFGCLRKGHITHDCKSKKACECGKGDHHKSLCEEVVPVIVVGTGKPDLVDRNHASVAYQTVLVKVSDLGNSSEVTCRAMMDSASGGTYMTQRLADRLSCGSKGKKTLTLEGIMKKGSTVTSETCDILVKSMNGRYQKKFRAKTLAVIAAIGNPKPLQLKAEYEHLEGIYFNDVCHDKHQEVEILIGLEDLPDILTGRNQKGKPGEPMAMETEFGWTILGPTGGAGTSKESALLVIETEPDIRDNLKCLWDLETVGIHEEDPVHEAFQEEIVFTGERYSVKLPWRAGKFNLPENRKLAEGHIKGQLKRLRKTPELLEAYDEVIQKQKHEGIVEPAPKEQTGERITYIPHQAVIRENAETTKLRIVYDASAKLTKGSKSLNNCLHTGPSLTPLLYDVLLRS